VIFKLKTKRFIGKKMAERGIAFATLTLDFIVKPKRALFCKQKMEEI
jgi:hypothetical protein